MAKFLLEIAKIVGTSTQNSGSWVHAFSPSQAEKISQLETQLKLQDNIIRYLLVKKGE